MTSTLKWSALEDSVRRMVRGWWRRDRAVGILAGSGVVALVAAVAGMALASGAHGVAIVTGSLLLAVQAVAWRMLFAGVGVLFLAVGGLGALAAYATMLLTTEVGWPWILAAVAGVTAAAVAGAVLAGIGARRRLTVVFGGVVTLIASLAFGQILLAAPALTGGETGRIIAQIPLGAMGSARALIVAAAMVVVALVLAWRIEISRLGHAGRAVRDDALGAQLAGLRLTVINMQVAAVAAALMGGAGLMKASMEGFVNPSMFAFAHVDVRVILAALVGGALGATIGSALGLAPRLGGLLGPVAGALSLGLADELLRPLGQLRTTLYGAMLLAVVWLLRGHVTAAATASDARPGSDGARVANTTAYGRSPRTGER